jgi:hypothetical protein
MVALVATMNQSIEQLNRDIATTFVAAFDESPEYCTIRLFQRLQIHFRELEISG